MKHKYIALCVATAALLGVPAVASAAEAGRFSNCTAAKAAGVYNIHKGHPDYDEDLDDDQDGVACEDAGKPMTTAPQAESTTTVKSPTTTKSPATTKPAAKPDSVKVDPKFTG
jgi:hypothetical protein